MNWWWRKRTGDEDTGELDAALAEKAAAEAQLRATRADNLEVARATRDLRRLADRFGPLIAEAFREGRS